MDDIFADIDCVDDDDVRAQTVQSGSRTDPIPIGGSSNSGGIGQPLANMSTSYTGGRIGSTQTCACDADVNPSAVAERDMDASTSAATATTHQQRPPTTRRQVHSNVCAVGAGCEPGLQHDTRGSQYGTATDPIVVSDGEEAGGGGARGKASGESTDTPVRAARCWCCGRGGRIVRYPRGLIQADASIGNTVQEARGSFHACVDNSACAGTGVSARAVAAPGKISKIIYPVHITNVCERCVSFT